MQDPDSLDDFELDRRAVQGFEELRRHMLGQSPLDADAVRERVHPFDVRCATLAALDEDGAVRDAFIERTTSEFGLDKLLHWTLGKIIFVQSEDEEAEAHIDELLGREEDAPKFAVALARAAALWEHDALWDLLDAEDDATRSAVACILAETDAQNLVDWIVHDRPADEDEILIVLRALALRAEAPVHQTIEAFLENVVELQQEDEPVEALKRGLEGLFAISDPLSYARGVLNGTYDAKWLRDSAAVADVLVTFGETSWLETLALLELGQTRDPFEFAALLATVASISLTPDLTEEQASALHEVQRALRAGDDDWEAHAVARGFKVAVAMGDEDLTPLLVEVALHERLSWNDHPSPGIVGLPLATNDEAAIDPDACATLFAEALSSKTPADETVVATVRTLCDLRRLHQQEVGAIGPILEDTQALLPQLAAHSNASINLAARRVITTVHPLSNVLADPPTNARQAAIAGIDEPEASLHLSQLARRDTVAGLWALHELCELPLEDSLGLLGDAWSLAHPARGAYVRALLTELIATDSF